MSKSLNRRLATVFGAVYILVGFVGFIATSAAGAGFVSVTGGHVFGIFEVNILHNIAHLLIGGALLFAGMSSIRAAKGTNTTIGAVYLLLGFVGMFLLNSPLNILALNEGDNVLHVASALVLLGIGLGADRNSSTHDVFNKRSTTV